MSKIWGIRYDDRDYNIGDEITPSHKYDLGVDTGEELSGTSMNPTSLNTSMANQKRIVENWTATMKRSTPVTTAPMYTSL